MAALTLERAVFTLESSAIEFVRTVAAIVVMVTLPLTRYAFAVGTFEFRLRTLSVRSFAHAVVFVRIVATIVLEIAHPSFRYAPVVIALEVCRRLAFRTVLGQFVGTVAAIVFAVAEQPFRYAPVIGLAWTPLPAGGAVTLSAHISRFV